MGAEGIKSLVDEWQRLGFHTADVDKQGNLIKWVDVCVYEKFFGGATLPCDWIALDEVTYGLYVKGTEPGKLVTRNDFVPTDKIPDWIFE